MGRVLAIVLAVVLGACGKDASSHVIHDGAPVASDAPTNTARCAELLATWDSLVDGASACSADDQCIVMDEVTECDGSSVWGGCATVVNRDELDASRAASLQSEWLALGCDSHRQLPDCGTSHEPGCVQGRCAVVVEQCCFCPPAADAGPAIDAMPGDGGGSRGGGAAAPT